MAHVKAAKDALEQTFTRLNCSKKVIDKTIKSDKLVSERVLTHQMKNLEDSLAELNTAHTTWRSKADFTPEQLKNEHYNAEWLEGQWDEVSELQVSFAEKILICTAATAPPVQTNAQKLQVFEKQMESLQQDIKIKVDQLMSRVSSSPIKVTALTGYEEMLSDIKQCLHVRFEQLLQSILALSSDLDTVLDDCETFRQSQQPKLVTIQLHLADAVADKSASAQSSLQPHMKGVEMEKSKAPTFNGRTLDYPHFKRGWKKVAGAVWTDDNQVEQIKLKVDERTRRLISRHQTMAEVWSALDAEYAQEQEVINAVNEELTNLCSSEFSTAEYIVELRNQLPVLEDVLQEVDGIEYLQSPDRVNYMVSCFDERTLHEYEYFWSKNKGTTYERFFKFLLDRYDASRSSIARLKSHSPHLSNNNIVALQNIHTTNLSSSSDCHRCSKWIARAGVHTCPGCGRGTPKDGKIHHCLEHCGAYLSMSANQRSDCVEKANWCPIHLTGGHSLQDCNMKSDPRFQCGVNGCKKHHHQTLHEGSTPFVIKINSTDVNNVSGSSEVLLLVQQVITKSGEVTVFYDNGSTCCLITFSAAEKLNLVGEAILISIKTTIGTKTLNSYAYRITLIDCTGGEHTITAFGVANISNHRNAIDVSRLCGQFSREVQENWDLIEQPEGEIELLIGMNALGLHPTDLEIRDNLKFMASKFGSGFMLAGSHPGLSSNSTEFNEDVSYIRLGSIPSMVRSVSMDVNAVRVSVKPSHEFFEGDILGVEPPKTCGNCLKCKDCSFRGQQLSQQEQYELRVIESKVTYNDSHQCFYVQYPFLDDPNVLPSNRGQVIKIAEPEEKKLMKECILQQFNAEFDKMLAENVIAELTEQEMNMWEGPVHYVSLQHVTREHNATTPVRIVANSSLSSKGGISLNNILMKGPNTLADQWEILNRWRMYPKALCSDLSKAYWSLRTGETEKHVRRIVWRHGDTSKPWRTYGFCVVSFGDKPAAAILEVAIRKTAEIHYDIDPVAARKIIDDRYVDDITSGGDTLQVARFAGNEEDVRGVGTMSQILGRGSFNMKVIVTSGECNAEKLWKLGDSVLGVGWDASSDKIFIDLNNINSTNHRLIQSLLESTPHVALLHSRLTLRQVLSILNSIYDPLGLIAPLTIRLKIAFRDLFRSELNLKWDDLIAAENHNSWIQLIQILTEGKAISFPRATKPEQAVGKPQLICFFDGSDLAYASVIYVKWTLADNSIFTTLLSCKSRVTPLQRISTPRSELNGAVLASRHILSTLKSWAPGDMAEKVWVIGDSECTLSSIEKVSSALGEYFGNRVGIIRTNQSKIEEMCRVGHDGEWYHTSSSCNAADKPTRTDSTPGDLGPLSEWQNGPPFLKLPETEWPINRDFASRKNNQIPHNEILKKYRSMIQAIEVEETVVEKTVVEETVAEDAVIEGTAGIHQLIDPNSTNDWDVLIRRTSAVLRAVEVLDKSKTSTIGQGAPNAKVLWFRSVMKDTVDAEKKGRLKELDLQQVDGMRVVIGRAKTGLRTLFGQNYLPVILGSTRVAELIMTSAHYKDHTGRDITQAMARQEAWIINAKKLAKQVVRRCVRCRYLRKLLLQQKISVLPDYVQIQCPPFTNIGLDLCGPYTVKAMTNKRATMKVWIVILLCLNTKAVSMELAPGYSTDDFLLAYGTHVSQRGIPLIVHSDRGSQLVAAKKELCDDPLRYDWDAIAAATASEGTSWKFAPAGAQWRNGATESFVKKFKNSFHHLYKDTKLNYAELLCAVKRISNILNHRPISVQRTRTDVHDDEFLSPLTPNMLVTGRSASGPPKDFADSEDPHIRLSFLDELERAWWYQYKVQYFQSLVPTRKWIDAKRNVAVGDIVLIVYTSKSAPGVYRLGRVRFVEMDNDGLVRTCTVVYKLIRPITDKNRDTVEDVVSKEVRVPVQRLVMILPSEEQ